jgi:hypothetical protein
VPENMPLSRIFVNEKERVTGAWRKLHIMRLVIYIRPPLHKLLLKISNEGRWHIQGM